MADRPISAVMRSDIPRLLPDDPIRQAVARLLAARTSAAPVLDASGNLVGILTERDCFRPALDASYYQQWTGVVRDVMSPDVATLDAGLDVVAAAQRYLDEPYRAFPVLEDGAVAGLLDRSALLEALLSNG